MGKKLLIRYIVLLIIALSGLFYIKNIIESSGKVEDYPQIKKRGVLRVVTEYNSVDYHVSGDTIAGLQYEICKFIEKHSELTVNIFLENNLEACIKGLHDGKYDVIAHSIPVTSRDKIDFAFTQPITQNKQVLVQRKAEYNDNIQPIRNQIDLAKKTLHVTANSPSILRLRNLAEEIADTIHIEVEKLYNAEQLIFMVAKGDIDYAVVDKEIAQTNSKEFPEIDYNTDISFTQLQAWAIRKDAPILLDSLNLWICEYKDRK